MNQELSEIRDVTRTDVTRTILARHQQRRAQGIPTLGVLVGAPAAAAASWEGWARSAGWQASVRGPGDPVEARPGEGVLFVCVDADQTALARLVERLCRLLDAPAWDLAACPLALVVAPAAAEGFLRDEPFSRTRTLFAEGMVVLPPTAVAANDYSPAIPPLAGASWRAETAASFTAAANAVRLVASSPTEPAQHDRARSAAERFLFELLADLPDTAGLFELNVRLDFCFGPMRAEVDLLAAGLRLAVEIDGFHHFREPDAYRRDRRKDALLQRQGFLVLRFLAADVVERLEEILEEIRRTVAFRRATAPDT